MIMCAAAACPHGVLPARTTTSLLPAPPQVYVLESRRVALAGRAAADSENLKRMPRPARVTVGSVRVGTSNTQPEASRVESAPTARQLATESQWGVIVVAKGLHDRAAAAWPFVDPSDSLMRTVIAQTSLKRPGGSCILIFFHLR